MPQGIDTPPPYVEETYLSAQDFEALRLSALALDGLSFRRMPATDSVASADTGTIGRNPRFDFRQSWWTAWKGAGATTLRWEGWMVRGGSEVLKLYINGVLKVTISANGAFSQDISLSGYSTGDYLDILIRVEGDSNKVGAYATTEMYTYPVATATAWVAPTAFSGNVFAPSKLNAMRTAVSWLHSRINAVPMLSTIAHVWAPATHKVESHRLYDGYVQRSYTEDDLRIQATVLCNNTAEQMLVYVNGALVYAPSMTAGNTYTFSPLVDLGNSVGSRLRVEILAYVASSSNQNQYKTVNSRYKIDAIRSEANTSYNYATPPAPFVYGTIPPGDLQSRLNAVVTILNTTKARIDATPHVFNRYHAFRRRYSYDDHQHAKLLKRHPNRFVRIGDRLIVKGKNVSIGWGAMKLKTTDEDGVNYSDYEFDHSESIISGDKVETVEFFLNTCTALYPGGAYWIYGDEVYYAAETLY